MVNLMGSPVSDDGRGLKLDADARLIQELLGSPVSDDGRGLKPSGIHGYSLPPWFARQ